MIFQKLMSVHVEPLFCGCTSHMAEGESGSGSGAATSDGTAGPSNGNAVSFEQKMSHLQGEIAKIVNTGVNWHCIPVAHFILCFLALW